MTTFKATARRVFIKRERIIRICSIMITGGQLRTATRVMVDGLKGNSMIDGASDLTASNSHNL